MRIIFFVASWFLLTACVHQQGIFDIDDASLKETSLLGTCHVFPYDDSDLPCNLLGWQQFASQTLNASEAEHKKALFLLTDMPKDRYKLMILNSSFYESTIVRQKSIEAMFKVSDEKNNGFGQLFHLLASYNHVSLLNKQHLERAETKLKVQTYKNTKLKRQLTDALAKIQAIMDIEQDLNSN